MIPTKQLVKKLSDSIKQYAYFPACLTLALGLLFVFGQSAYAQESTNEILITGSISGTILNADAEPMAGIVVTAYRSDDPGVDNPIWDEHKSTVSDTDGKYKLDLLTTGIYRLGISDPSAMYLPQFFTNADDLQDAPDIPVIGGDELTGYNFVAQKGGRISGMVMDVIDSLLADISVKAYRRTPTEWKLVQVTKTDASGSYTLDTLTPGRYIVYFEEVGQTYVDVYYGNATSPTDATEIVIANGTERDNINVLLKEFGSISGSVVLTDSTFGTDVTISAYSSANDFQRPIFQNTYYNPSYLDSFEYTIPQLKPGNYIVRATSSYYSFYLDEGEYSLAYYDTSQNIEGATPIVVENGDNIPNIDFILDTEVQLASLQGTVRADSGEPLENIRVEILDGFPCNLEYAEDYYDYSYPPPCLHNPQPIAQTYTDAEGNYRLSDIWLDSYTIRFIDSTSVGGTAQFPTLLSYVTQLIAQQLDPAENTLDIAVQKGGALTGLVSTWDERTPQGATITLYESRNKFWVPVSDLYVSTYEPYIDTDKYPASPHPMPLPLAEDGQPTLPLNGFGYSFSGLPGGNYRVGISGTDENGDAFNTFYANASDISAATSISVTSGTVADSVDLIVGEDSATANIDGYVIESGIPQVGIRVELYGRSFDYYFGFYWPLLVFTTTDDQGYYLFDGLEEGEYKLRLVTPDSDEMPIYYGGVYSLEEAQIVQIGVGTGTINVRIDPLEPVDGLQDEPLDEPVDEPADEPGDDPTDEPVDEPQDEPVDEPQDEPADEPQDEPADEPQGQMNHFIYAPVSMH